LQVSQVSVALCSPPHRITHEEKLRSLTQSMRQGGWVGRPLIGYTAASGIQLISGSHRIVAAKDAGLATVPVKVYTENYIKQIWGTDEWLEVMG
jgi:ParB-like chromosome segregation protein Spo0J